MHFYRALTRSYVICRTFSNPCKHTHTHTARQYISFALISIFAYFSPTFSHTHTHTLCLARYASTALIVFVYFIYFCFRRGWCCCFFSLSFSFFHIIYKIHKRNTLKQTHEKKNIKKKRRKEMITFERRKKKCVRALLWLACVYLCEIHSLALWFCCVAVSVFLWHNTYIKWNKQKLLKYICEFKLSKQIFIQLK